MKNCSMFVHVAYGRGRGNEHAKAKQTLLSPRFLSNVHWWIRDLLIHLMNYHLMKKSNMAALTVCGKNKRFLRNKFFTKVKSGKTS